MKDDKIEKKEKQGWGRQEGRRRKQSRKEGKREKRVGERKQNLQIHTHEILNTGIKEGSEMITAMKMN